jgi:succinate-acetate transporter protein
MNEQGHKRPMSRKRMLRMAGWIAMACGGVALTLHAWLGWSGSRQLGVVFLCVGGVWLASAYFASAEPMRKNQRRYLREFFPAMLAYLVLVFAFKPLLGLVDSTAMRIVIALLPVLPIVFVVRAMVRKLLDGDELERRMQLEAVSIASISVGLLSFAAGFMGMAGVFHVEHDLLMVLPALFLAYGAALWWVRRRYQGR